MNQSQRNTPQQLQGIVRMVYDLYERIGLTPVASDYYIAIRDWLECGKTPTEFTCAIEPFVEEVNLIKSSVDDDYNTCVICDSKITGSSTYCDNCYEKEK